jgi:hypothetical protein
MRKQLTFFSAVILFTMLCAQQVTAQMELTYYSNMLKYTSYGLKLRMSSTLFLQKYPNAEVVNKSSEKTEYRLIDKSNGEIFGIEGKVKDNILVNWSVLISRSRLQSAGGVDKMMQDLGKIFGPVFKKEQGDKMISNTWVSNDGNVAMTAQYPPDKQWFLIIASFNDKARFMGEVFNINGFALKITGVNYASSLVNGGAECRPKGVYIVIDAEITNTNKIKSDFNVPDLRIVRIINGKDEYYYMDNKVLAIGNKAPDTPLANFEPGIMRKVKLIYDIPDKDIRSKLIAAVINPFMINLFSIKYLE